MYWIFRKSRAQARVIFHIEASFHDRYRQALHLSLFPVIEDMIRARGGDVVIERRGPRTLPAKRRWGDGDLHIVQGGTSRGVGYLNAGLAYLTGFWHLDPQGVLADSSALNHPFDPKQVDPQKAAAFQELLFERFCVPRRSRYFQTRKTQLVPKDCIAVFLQGAAPTARDHQFISQHEMLRSVVAAADGRAVVVKPHPISTEFGHKLMADLRGEGLQFLDSAANVHDLLAACAVSVSINSAAAVEGFLHRKPAILCGRSDYPSQIEAVRRAEDMAPALQRAMNTPRDYAPWLYWYFNQFCLNLEAPDVHERIQNIFTQAGFGPDRLFPKGP